VEGLPVAVEIAPPDAPREHVSALLAACSRALADSECVLSSEAPEDGSRAVAIVTWQGEGRAQIEVGLRREGRPEWRARTLDFEAKDELSERWRTVGFVVGTLSRPELRPDAKLDGAEPDPVVAPPVTDVRPSEPVPPRAPSDARPERGSGARAAIDIGAVTGPALDGMRSGALVRARFRIAESLRAVTGLHYLELPSDERGLSARWATASGGVGAVLGDDSVELSFGIDARGEYVNARANGRWHHNLFPGVGVGVTGAWMPSRWVGLFVGAEGAWIFGTREFRLTPESIVVEPALRINAEAGVRLRLR